MSEKTKSYARGYSAGSRRAWPNHRPPTPPDQIAGPIISSAVKMRDAAADICSRLDKDDDFSKLLAPQIEAFDSAMAKLSEWLKSDRPLNK